MKEEGYLAKQPVYTRMVIIGYSKHAHKMYTWHRSDVGTSGVGRLLENPIYFYG